jgi:hypothetical protein
MGQLFSSSGAVFVISLATMLSADWVFGKLTRRW